MSNDDDDGDDGDWGLLEDLARSSDPHHQRSAVAEAATKTEELLRTLGYLARSTPPPGSNVPKTLSESMRLLVAAIPLNDLDTKLRFAREVRNRLAHEPQKLGHIDLLQAFLGFRQFVTDVAKWVKSARYPSVGELRRRAGRRMSQSNFSPTELRSDEEPRRPSTDPSAFRTGDVDAWLDPIGSEPSPKEDLRSIGATVRELWAGASEATDVLAGRLAASDAVHLCKRTLIGSVYAVLGIYALLTTAALTIGSLSSYGGAELVARGFALLAFACISIFGNVIVFAATFASESVRGALEPGRRILLAILASGARSQAIQELTRSKGPAVAEKFAARLAELIPKYLVGTLTLPLSIWAVWVFCFPYWSLAIWGIAIVAIIVIVYGAGARGSSNWDEASKRARVFVLTASVAGVLLAVLVLQFEALASEVRSVADLASGFTEGHLANIGTLVDFGPASVWRSAPGVALERTAVLGSVLWPFGLVLAMAYSALSKGAALAGGSGALGLAKISGIVLVLGWVGIVAVKALGSDKAEASVLDLDGRSEKGMEADRGDGQQGISETGPQEEAQWNAPSAPTDWRQSLFSPTCAEPCSAGAACAAIPKRCASGITCVEGEASEKLKSEEDWNLHLTSISLSGADGTRVHGCQTTRDLWLCRQGSNECLSQRDACAHVRVAAISEASIPVTGRDILGGGVAFEVREGGRLGTVIARTTAIPPDLKRRGLCPGFKVDAIDTASRGSGMAWFFLLPRSG